MLASLAEMLAGATTLRHFWEPTWELFWSMIRRAFRSISILSIGILSIGILVNRHFGQSTFWSIGILVNRHFGQSTFWSIGILVNRHFVNWYFGKSAFCQLGFCQLAFCQLAFWSIGILSILKVVISVKVDQNPILSTHNSDNPVPTIFSRTDKV